MAKQPRSLGIESLEARRVLTAGPIATDIQLLSFDPADGTVRVSENSQLETVEVNRHPAARNGVLKPFLSGDFNGDDVTDLLATDTDDNSWWLQLNDGTQLFELPVGLALNDTQVIGTADFNQDGRLDVASFNEATNELWISVNTEDGFVHRQWGSFPVGSSLDQLHIGDFNGDGRTDILTGETAGTWQLAANQGLSFDVQEWGQFPDFSWKEVRSGNFNSDQVSDVVALAPDNTWWLWQGADSGFGEAQFFGHWKMATGWTDIGVGDFTGDGIDDVIGRTPDGKLRVGTATDSGFETWIWGSGWIDSADWRNVTVLDLNGDDLADQLSQAKDGTWWYAINTDGGFSNYYWQRASQVDFVVTDFRAAAIDVIDSLPGDGVDVRELDVAATLTTQNRFELTANGPVQIDGIMFRSASGSLVPRANGSVAELGASSHQVSYGSITPRLTSEPLRLDVGWDASGTADLMASVAVGSSVLPISVPPSIGPAVTAAVVPAATANQLYFTSLPISLFLPAFELAGMRMNATANTISSADAKLRVARSENNRIVLTPVEPLLLTGIELRSPSDSLIPLAGEGEAVIADPFISALLNSPSRIILESEAWPFLLSQELVLDIGWLRNSTASDLIVEYRLASDPSTVQQAYVAEPLRLPFVDSTGTTPTNPIGGPVRVSS